MLKNKLKIIFCDIDGVLNNVAGRHKYGSYDHMDSFMVAELARIINKTGAKIVFSSAWRAGGVGPSSDIWNCLETACNFTDTLEFKLDLLGDELLFKRGWITSEELQARKTRALPATRTDFDTITRTIIGITPSMPSEPGGWSWSLEASGEAERAQEINLWLQRNPEVTDYVVLDDLNMGYWFEERMILTDEEIGLTRELANKAITILGENHA